MNDALTPDDREALSSYLDHEFDSENSGEIESQLNRSFSAQVHFRNLEALSRASQQKETAKSGNDDFLNRLMFAVEDLEQEDPNADFECVSAWYDQEFDLDSSEVMSQSADWVQNLSSLSQAMQALPQPEAAIDFSDKVMRAIDATLTPDNETLSAYFDGGSQFQAVREFSGAKHNAATQTHLNNLSHLSHAIHRLPTPAAASNFAEQVFKALPTQAQDLSDLSAWYDQETNFENSPKSGWLQNFALVSQAIQGLPAYEPSADFVATVMTQIDRIDTLENQSAIYDGEAEGQANVHWQAQFTQLSQAFQQATVYQASPDFINKLSQRLDEADSLSTDWTENLTRLSQALQALPVAQAPDNFVANLMRKIDSLALQLDLESLSAIYDGEQAGELTPVQAIPFEKLSKAMQALPQIQAPVGFAAQVMQTIDAQADFETLSAWHDQELDAKISQILEQNQQQERLDIKQIKTLSKAIQALPQIEAPPNFVARVMLATEQETLAPTAKAKLFALPGILGTRLGQMVAAIAIFGVMVTVSQILLNQTQPGTIGVTAAVPSNYIVQVEHQPEDLLFSSNVNTLSVDSSLVIEATLENISEIDYNLMIGG